MVNRAKKITIGVVSLVVLIIAAAVGLGFYTEILSVKELGDAFLGVFYTNLKVKIVSRSISFLGVFAMFFISTSVVSRIAKDKTGPVSKILQKLSFKIIISLIVSVFASAYVSETIYDTYLLFANGTDFNMVDPLFGRDIGYYIFTRPFMAALINSLISVWLVVTLYSFFLYLLVFVSPFLNAPTLNTVFHRI